MHISEKVMEILRKKEIKNTQERLDLKFNRDMVDPRASKRDYLLQVWNSGKVTIFRETMAQIFREYGQGVNDQVKTFSALKYLAIRMGSNIVCVGKEVKVVHGAQALWYQTVWCVTVGAGVCFGAARGQTLKEAGQKARRVWVDRIFKAATRRGDCEGITQQGTVRQRASALRACACRSQRLFG